MLSSNLSERLVLIVGNCSLFEEGLTRLLTFETELQVLCSKYTNDFSFMEDVAKKRPDVVLLTESVPINPSHILNLLFSNSLLIGLRVVVMRLGNNMIDVYRAPVERDLYPREQFLITKRDELVAVVRG